MGEYRNCEAFHNIYIFPNPQRMLLTKVPLYYNQTINILTKCLIAGSTSTFVLFAWTDRNSFHTAHFLFSIDHPLHSTALDAYGEEHSQSESLGRVSEPQRKNTGRSGEKKSLLAFNLIF